MVFVIALFILLVCKVDASFYYETDTRIIILSGEHPEDGHLRLFRSASARNLFPVLLRILNQTSEVKEVSKYLNSVSFENNEIGLITSSDNYLATHDASNLAMNVAKVALIKDGNIVLAYPMERNLSSFATPVDDGIKTVQNALDSLRNDKEDSYHPAPETLEEWKIGTTLYSKYRRLLVKQKKYQYKLASVYNEKYCAFAGLTKALKYLFDKLASEGREDASLTKLCINLAKNESLAYELRIVKDFEGHVFKRIESSITDAILVKDPKSKESANHLDSSSFSFAPFTFAEPGKLNYVVANFASGDIISPLRKNVQYFDSKIQNLTEHFHGLKNIPLVQIIAIITHEGTNFGNFLNNIARLSYPKIKTKIDILFQHSRQEEDIKKLQETLRVLQSDNSTAFHSMRAVIIDNSDVNAVYEKAWSFAREAETNYTFLVHSSVRFTDQHVVEELLKLNRKVISPILESQNGECNFKADYENNILTDNVLSEPFSSQYEDMENENISTIGLLQVPYVFGAILLRKDVVQKMNFYFDLCPPTCRKGDEACMKKKESQNCEANYYENLESPDQRVWGMMCKNIVEDGFILYLSNENIYGDFDLTKNEIANKNKDETPKKNEQNENEDNNDLDEVEIQQQSDSEDITSAIVKTPSPDAATLKDQKLY